jgi:hypothetical protein
MRDLLEDNVRILDPWAGEWITRDEMAARCYRYALDAERTRYRVRRLWHRLRHGVWLPDAEWFRRHAEFTMMGREWRGSS